MDYEIGGKQGWTKTHCRANLGASFCRRVNMDQCDWIGVIAEGEEPSCEECKWMMKALQNLEDIRSHPEEKEIYWCCPLCNEIFDESKVSGGQISGLVKHLVEDHYVKIISSRRMAFASVYRKTVLEKKLGKKIE